MAEPIRVGPSGEFLEGDEAAPDAVAGDVLLAWDPVADPPGWTSRKLPAGGAPNITPVEVTFNMTTGLQKFTVAVPGITTAARCWLSLNGDTNPSGEKVAAGGAWASGDNEVTLLADYESLDPATSLQVPLLVFWFAS